MRAKRLAKSRSLARAAFPAQLADGDPWVAHPSLPERVHRGLALDSLRCPSLLDHLRPCPATGVATRPGSEELAPHHAALCELVVVDLVRMVLVHRLDQLIHTAIHVIAQQTRREQSDRIAFRCPAQIDGMRDVCVFAAGCSKQLAC
eukprot:SAG11_NODE_666_length_7841_cov_24.388272_3_plen_147_part_00